MLRLYLILAAILNSSYGANILGLMGAPAHSHFQFNSAIMHELARRGHNVTVLAIDVPKPGQKIPENVHYIHLENIYKHMYEQNKGGANLSIENWIGKSGLKGISIFYEFCMHISKGTVTSKGFHELLNYPDNFKVDVVLYDYTKGSILLGFLEKFNNPPLIGVTAFLNPPITSDLVGNQMFPSYIPHWVTAYDVDMSFFERVHNSLIYIYEYLFRTFVLTPHYDKILRPFYPKGTPYLGDLEKRTVLTLVNTNPAINYAESLPPNVIEVGDYRLQNQRLSRKKFKISWTILKMEQFTFPLELIDIFGHSKLKVFITHSGALSTQEAIWFGIPMIGMALFVDQPRNLNKCVLNGVAAKLDFFNLSVKVLKDTILKVAEDSTFAENVRERSRLYRDQPMKPLDKAIWWIEYVIRNPKANHLRSPAVHMNIFSSRSLDVIAFFIVLFVIFVMMVIFLIQCFCKLSKTKVKIN
uniref:UDP-glucuronosyltransferase n=1 Tax=Megaselia scalaris TaxID=36166 RepID=T1GNM6_MEGSC